MNFLGEANTGSGVTPEQEEKLDAITVEPTGEVKFDQGIIVNGGSTELKTTITEVDDPILQINRSNTGVTSGITIKNTDDGKYNSILRSGTSYFFTKDTTTDSSLGVNALERANIVCGNVNSVNVGQLNGDYNLHVADTSIHTPLDDLQTTANNLWSASKINSEITANSGAIIDDVNPAIDKVYSSSKTQNIVDGVQTNLTNHTTNLNIHRPVSDGLISTSSLWSSQKTANEIQNVNTALGLHTTNNAIHAELNDALQTNTNLWSASKISTEIAANAGVIIDDITPAVDKVYSSSKTQNIVDLLQTNLTNLETTATRSLIQDSTGESKIELSDVKITNTADEHSFIYKEPTVAGPTYLFQYTSGNGVISNGGLTGTLPNTTGNRTVVTENASWFSFGDVRKWKVQINSYSGAGLVLGITKWNIPGQLPALGDIPNQDFVKTADNMFLFTNGGGFLLWDPILGDLPFPGANGNSVANGHSVEFKIEADGKVYVNTETNNNVDTLLYTIPNDGAVWKFWLGDNTDLVSNATVTSVAVSGAGGFTPVQKLNIADEILITSNVNITGDLKVTGNTTSTNLDNHINDATVHFTIDDGSTGLDKVYSSSKTQNIVDTVDSKLDGHVTNDTIHFIIDDGSHGLNKVYSSSKIKAELTTIDQTIEDLKTSATRSLIQDSSGETKIELTQPQLSLTSVETKIKAYDVVPGTVQYEWEPTTNFNCILSNANTRATCPAVAGIAEARVRDSDAFIAGNETKEYIISFENCVGNYTLAGLVLSSHPNVNGVTSRNVNRWWLFRSGPNLFTAVGCPPADLAGSNVNNADGDRFKFTVDLLGNVTVEKIPPYPVGNWDYNGGAPFTYPTQLTLGQEYRFFVADEDLNNFNPVETGSVQLQPVPTAVPILTPVDVLTVGNNLVDVTGDLKISGDLLVSGSTTTVNTDNITIEDPLIKLANQNITNITNIGFIGQYNDGVQKYSGLMQTYNNNDWYLIGGTTQVPSEAVIPTYLNTELAILNLNKVRLTEVLPYNPVQGIRLINGTEEINVDNNSIDFTNTSFNVNSVQQDTAVSAFGQFYVDFSLTSPFTTLLNSGYASAFSIPPTNATGANVGFNSLTNTFTIQHAGWYRFSYHISIRNTDDDNTFIQVSLQKNGVQNDAFELSSMTRHLRQRNRVTTLSTTFIHNMVVNDTVRMYLEAFLDTGAGGNENIDVFDVNVNLERMRTNF